MKSLALFLLLLHHSFATNESTSTPSSSRSEPLSTTLSASIPRQGVDFIGPLWLPRTFKITCCRGGLPQAENNLLIRNWTERASDYAVDEDSDDACRVYEGGFLLAATALFNLKSFTGYGVQCKCPEKSSTEALDKHCRRLPPCQNNGYRSFSLNMRCACPEPFFGEFCEKICDQGQKLKGVDGRDYCSCVPFYQGEECRDMVCLNGGVESGGRCACPPSFLGYHCEIDTNRSSAIGSSRYQKFGDNGDVLTRDISGTIFSLIMIVVLVVSMYLLMKHRIQGRSSRREETVVRSVYRLPRRGDVISPEGIRTIPFSAMGIEGPPPYAAMPSRGRVRAADLLPPLPSYDDATKLPPLRSQRGQANHPSVVSVPETPPSTSATASSAPPSSDSPPPSTAASSQPSHSSPEPSSSTDVFSLNRILPSRRSV